MKCELLAESNLALLLDFVDDEDTKYLFWKHETDWHDSSS